MPGAIALRVLIVEDDAMLGELLGDMLEQIGHTVCGIVRTEADAIAAAAHECPDLMIVDARLGRGSGIAAMAAILATRFVPHIFMSGNVAAVVGSCPGAIVLCKPFGEPQIASAVRQALALV